MPLQRQPHIADPDGFYEALNGAQRDMTDDQADAFLAQLVLVLSNHIGDRAVLDEALALARSTTLRHAVATAATTAPTTA